MNIISDLGASWLSNEVGNFTESITHISPSDFNEQNRYLPPSVTPMPGYIRYDVNPYMREIINCFDVDSPVREVNLKKGVQITYTTLLESGALYYMGHIKTLPMMFMTADKELADARIENSFIPMLNESGFADIIRSNDVGNSKKTGKTSKHLQFAGGGVLYPFGAINATKMRMFSIAIMMKDELDGWPEYVGKDGCPDKLSDARCSGFWERRKIFRGSTPLLYGTSKIEKAYNRGDKRKYMVLCKSCGFPQFLKWETVNKENGIIGGFQWDYDDNGSLNLESVRYCCQNCGVEHFEHDKRKLYSEEHGAHWMPTATPAEAGIRSYHLPALYSPNGLAPWSKCVSDYLQAFDPVAKKVIDIKAYQQFYNNILAEPFKILGSKISFTAVSLHRRWAYRFGMIPNEYAKQWSGSPILLLTMQVDVHKDNLAVSVMGWTRDSKCYVIEYMRIEPEEKGDTDCTEISSSVWKKLRELIEEKVYIADDKKKYRIALTFIDAGYANATVLTFCDDYADSVYPILGRDRPDKSNTITEFAEFTTKTGTTGYKITVDHYKDRLAPVLRREWVEDSGEQKPHHFNAPADITGAQLTELTKEFRRKKTNAKGVDSYYWYRPSGAQNELWDLLVYGHAAVEILAWLTCIEHFELETVDWNQFWDYLENEKVYFTEE